MADLVPFTFNTDDGEVVWSNPSLFPQTLDTESDVRAMFQQQPDLFAAYLNDQVVPAVNDKLDKAGGTMTDEIDMGGNKITDVGTPTEGTDAATKAYVDGSYALYPCTFGVTTYNEITAALAAGKLPVCIVIDEDEATSTVYVYSSSYENALDMMTVYEFQIAYQDATEKAVIKGLSCHFDDQWRTFEVELATKSALDQHYVTAGQKSGTTLGTKATAEGSYTTARGSYSHAEGYGTTTSAYGAHAEGYYTKASDAYSHAEGSQTEAGGAASHAEGYGTVAASAYQHVFGKCNVPDSASTYVEIVGNGTSPGSQNVSNARTLDWSGNERLAGKLTLGAAPTAYMDAATKKYVDDAATGAVSTAIGAAIAADNAIYVSADQTAEEIYNAVKTAYFAHKMVYAQFEYADDSAEGGFRLLSLPVAECEGVTSQTYTRFVFSAAVYNRVYSAAITKNGSSYQRSDVLMHELWQE